MGVAALAGAAAVSVAAAGFSAIEQSKAAGVQAKLDESAIGLNTQQAKTKAAVESAQSASQFRQALASQVSLAGMRGGSGSIARQFGTESLSNFLQDQEAISAGISLADIQALHSRSQSTATRTAANIRAGAGFVQSAVNAINMNSVAGGGS